MPDTPLDLPLGAMSAPEGEGGLNALLREHRGLFGLAAFLVALRLFFAPFVELLPEEAYYWNYAQHPALGYLDHPPMVAWLISAGTFLLGHNPIGVRLGALLCWGVAARFLYCFGRNLFGPAAGARAVLLAAALPANFGTGFFMTPDAPLVACWAGALYFFQRAFFQGSAWGWVGAGACIGLGMDSKYTIALTGLGAIAFVLIDPASRRWLRHPAPYAAAALSVALFAPVIIWNAQNGWASFVFQGPRRFAAASRFSLHELLASAVILVTPVGFAAALVALFGKTEGGAERRRRFVRIFTFVPLVIFAYFSLRHRVEFNWTAPLWLAVLPALGAAMDRGWQRAWWPPTLAVLALLYGGAFYHLAFGWPGLGYPRQIELFPAGWKNLGAKVDRAEDVLEGETGTEPIIVALDRYQIVSELIFYDPDQTESLSNDVGSHLIGQRDLMYERWSHASQFAGRNTVLVSLDAKSLDDPVIARHFSRISGIMQQDIVFHGRVVRPFYYRYGYEYLPHLRKS